MRIDVTYNLSNKRNSLIGLPFGRRANPFLNLDKRREIFNNSLSEVGYMCTVNMTFEVPESRSIDIEALKRNIEAYVKFVISYPSVLKKEEKSSTEYTDKMLGRFAGCWHGDETPEQIMSMIRENSSIREPLFM